MLGRDIYAKNVQMVGVSPSETEILAFSLCIAKLKACTESTSRIEALNKTHQLWSLLVRDLASNANRLPEILKEQLVDLGFWAMGYCVAAMGRDLPVQPLIDVNQNILEGLRLQSETFAGVDPGTTRMPFVSAQA
jgi:flagellar protein FlaF